MFRRIESRIDRRGTVGAAFRAISLLVILAPVFYLPHLLLAVRGRGSSDVPLLLQAAAAGRDAFALGFTTAAIIALVYGARRGPNALAAIWLVVCSVRLIADLPFAHGSAFAFLRASVDILLSATYVVFFATIPLSVSVVNRVARYIAGSILIVGAFAIVEILVPRLALFAFLFRFRSTLFSPTSLGAYSAMGIALAIAQFRGMRDRLFYALCLAVSVVLVVASGSRTAIFAAAIASFISVCAGRRGWRTVASAAVLGGLAILAYSVFLGIVDASLPDLRFADTGSWSIRRNPRFQHILGQFQELTPIGLLLGTGPFVNTVPPDSQWIVILISFGPLFASPYFVMHAGALVRGHRLLRLSRGDRQTRVCALTITSVGILSVLIQLTTNIVSIYPINLLFFSALGALLNNSLRSDAAGRARKRIARD